MDRIQAAHALGLTLPCTRDQAEETYRQRLEFLQPHLRDPAARESALKLEAQYEEAWRTLNQAVPTTAPPAPPPPAPPARVEAPPADTPPPPPPPPPSPSQPPPPSQGPVSAAAGGPPPPPPYRATSPTPPNKRPGRAGRVVRGVVALMVLGVLVLAGIGAYQEMQPNVDRNSCVHEAFDGTLETVKCSSRRADFKVKKQVDDQWDCKGEVMEKKTLYFFKQTYCLAAIPK